MDQNDEHDEYQPSPFVAVITSLAVFATITGVLTLTWLLLTKWLG